MKRSTFNVPVRNECLPRVECVQKRYGLSQQEAVELGLNLAVVAADGVMLRVLGPPKDRDGRALTVGQVLKQMHYSGQVKELQEA